MLLTIMASSQESKPAHPDYVPNEQVAARIAEAVLVGQYGEKRVKPQLPLLVISRNKDEWMAQGRIVDKQGQTQVGGGFGVLLRKHDGCVLLVAEEMK